MRESLCAVNICKKFNLYQQCSVLKVFFCLFVYYTLMYNHLKKYFPAGCCWYTVSKSTTGIIIMLSHILLKLLKS